MDANEGAIGTHVVFLQSDVYNLSRENLVNTLCPSAPNFSSRYNQFRNICFLFQGQVRNASVIAATFTAMTRSIAGREYANRATMHTAIGFAGSSIL